MHTSLYVLLLSCNNFFVKRIMGQIHSRKEYVEICNRIIGRIIGSALVQAHNLNMILQRLCVHMTCYAIVCMWPSSVETTRSLNCIYMWRLYSYCRVKNCTKVRISIRGTVE